MGKSSTINTIFRNKVVSVSATPGHTKHFQVTLNKLLMSMSVMASTVIHQIKGIKVCILFNFNNITTITEFLK